MSDLISSMILIFFGLLMLIVLVGVIRFLIFLSKIVMALAGLILPVNLLNSMDVSANDGGTKSLVNALPQWLRTRLQGRSGGRHG